MRDKAYSDMSASLTSSLMRDLRDPPSATTEKIVPLNLATMTPPRDWSATVQLVYEANEAMRVSWDRVAELEEQLERFAVDADDEIKQLHFRIASADKRIRQLEQQTHDAEARAHEAETWLVRLHEVIVSSFSQLVRSRDSGRAKGAALAVRTSRAPA